jgi:thioredoxin-like negative regulator of GroEL
MSTRENTSSPRKTSLFVLVAVLSVAAFVVSFTVTNRNARSNYVPLMEATTEKIGWQPDFEVAQATARKSDKPLMMVFHADWCGVCQQMNAGTYPDARVVRESNSFSMVKVDVDKRPDVAQQFRVSELPTIIWLNGQGELLARVSGLYAPDEMAELMQKVHSQAGSSS